MRDLLLTVLKFSNLWPGYITEIHFKYEANVIQIMPIKILNLIRKVMNFSQYVKKIQQTFEIN